MSIDIFNNQVAHIIMQKVYSLLILAFIAIGLGSFVDNEPIEPVKKVKVPDFIKIDDPWVDSILSLLTLEQKIAQLIMYPVYTKNGEAELMKIV